MACGILTARLLRYHAGQALRNLHMPSSCTFSFAIFFSLAAAVVGAAPVATTAPAEIALAQRAGDAALQDLIDHVYDLRCASTRKLSTELAAAPEADLAFRERILAERRLSEPRSVTSGAAGAIGAAGRSGEPAAVPPGGVEVTASIRTRRLHEMLQQLAAGNPLLDAKRLTLPPSAGTELTGTGRAWPDANPRGVQPGWRHCSLRQMELAEDAAAADARRNLMLQIAMLRAGESRTVGQIFVLYGSMRKEVARRVEALQPEPAVWEPTGVCRRRLALTSAQVREMLRAAARSAAAGQEPDANLQAVETAGEDISVQGYAVAPPMEQVVRVSTRPAGPVRPTWTGRVLTAQGVARAQAPEAGKAPADMAARAARIEALRQLWLELERLPMSSGESLGAFLQRQPSRAELMAAIEKHIVPTGKPKLDADGSIAVTLTVRLEDVWSVLTTAQRHGEDSN